MIAHDAGLVAGEEPVLEAAGGSRCGAGGPLPVPAGRRAADGGRAGLARAHGLDVATARPATRTRPWSRAADRCGRSGRRSCSGRRGARRPRSGVMVSLGTAPREPLGAGATGHSALNVPHSDDRAAGRRTVSLAGAGLVTRSGPDRRRYGGRRMSTSFRPQVAAAFEVLAEGLAPFVDARMSALDPDEDWILMAAAKLGKRRDVLVSLVDPHFQLEVINRWWGPAFSPVLAESMRPVVTDLRTARNHWAHPDDGPPLRPRLRPRRAPVGRGAAAGRRRRRRPTTIGRPGRGRCAGSRSTRPPGSRASPRPRSCSRSWSASRPSRSRSAPSWSRPGRRPQRRPADRGRCRASWPSSRPSTRPWPASATTTSSSSASSTASGRCARPTSATPASCASGSSAPPSRPGASRPRPRCSASSSSAPATRWPTLDPVDTEIGRRWIWLVTAMIVVLGVLIALIGYTPR